MEQQTLQKTKQLAEEFFKAIGALGTIEVRAGEDNEVLVEATLSEPQLFIGEKGQTLFEVQHILKAIVRKQAQEVQPLYVSLDINEYKQNKEAYLKELARNAADEVALLKKTKELPAMTASERRIVHMELAERSGVATESAGQDPDRRVVIKPN